jgi:hypothetical protein
MFNSSKYQGYIKSKKRVHSKHILLCTLLSWTSSFIQAKATGLTSEGSKQQYAMKGIGFYVFPKSSREYLTPPFYQAHLLQLTPSESTIITADGSASAAPRLYANNKFDDLPLACSQTISTERSLAFTSGKQKIESQYTINTSIVACSVL